MFAVQAIIEGGNVASYTEVAIDAQVDITRSGKIDAFHNLRFNIFHNFVAFGEADALFAHRQGEPLAVLLHGQHAGITVEGGKSGAVASLEVTQVDAYAAAT